MQDLVQALLNYSRIATKAGPFVKVDLNSLVHGVLRDLDTIVKNTCARIELGDLPTIEADPYQIHRLFQHIIENALKFKGAGDPGVRIHSQVLKESLEDEVAGPHPQEFCRITVQDNGIGIEEKYLNRIFMPFKRLHSRRSPYEGVGMGLAICRKVAEVHGGTITASSTPGKGSTFVITLPVKQQAS